MLRKWLSLGWLLIIPAINLHAQTNATDLTQQRALFWQARSALQHGQYDKFRQLSPLLKNYVLYPYLQYAALTQHLPQATSAQIDSFLQTYADTPLAQRLRAQWLTQLANQHQWISFVKYYHPTEDISLRCQYAYALLATDHSTTGSQQAAALWLMPSELPKTCQATFNLWQKSGRLTQSLIWKKLALLLNAGDKIQFLKLTNLLSKNEQTQAALWQRLYANPNLLTQSNLLQPFAAHQQTLLITTLLNYADKNPEAAANLWLAIHGHYALSLEQQQTIVAAIAVGLAHHSDPQAASWLATVQPDYSDQIIQEWRVRMALLQQNWSQVIYWIDQLPPAAQSTAQWRYWYARALAAEDQNQQATAIYEALSQHLTYYGLLARKQLQLTGALPLYTYPVAPQTMAGLFAIPAIQRAQELYALALTGDARREWQWATADMDDQQLIASAQLALQWKWLDRAMWAMRQAGVQDDVNVCFPIAYAQQVKLTAKRLNLNPAWILAIIRQESSFMPDAKSGAGALGLMQLLPRTVQTLINKRLRLDDEDLLNANRNIYWGSSYLKLLLAWFHHDQVVATAAYNAGPTRLGNWLALQKKLPQDIWIEILPWRETRDYVKSVWLATQVYQQELKMSVLN